MQEIAIPKTAVPKKIWTNKLLMQDNDLVRYRKQYTIKLECKDHFWLEVDHWFQTDAYISPKGSCAYMDSPEGFGPAHIIRLPYGAFWEEYRDLVKRLLVAAVEPCRDSARYADELRGTDYNDPEFACTYRVFTKALRRLDLYLPYIKRYTKMVYEEANAEDVLKYLFSE